MKKKDQCRDMYSILYFLLSSASILFHVFCNGSFFHPTEMSLSLQEQDPEIYDLIRKEKNRQKEGIELIASEVSTYIMFPSSSRTKKPTSFACPSINSNFSLSHRTLHHEQLRKS